MWETVERLGKVLGLRRQYIDLKIIHFAKEFQS